MSAELVHAHQALDRAVDAAYAGNADRVAFLFELYQRQTSLLPTGAPPTTGRRRLRR